MKGWKGAKILVNPDDPEAESGKPLGQKTELELKELTNRGEPLRTNAQAVSGGVYFIGMTSNGEQLKLKERKSLSVQFPKLSDKEMAQG